MALATLLHINSTYNKHLLWEVHGGLLGFTHPDQVVWGFALAVVTVLHS